MNKQTAVEWLATYLKGVTFLNCDEVIEQAQQMEKEQIINACNQTEVIGLDHEQPGEQYYNQTFNKREMKQTAVEWLQVQLNENGKLSAVDFYQAKQIETEQSLNFAKYCLDKAKDLDVRTAYLNVEKYYNETFNTKEK